MHHLLKHIYQALASLHIYGGSPELLLLELVERIRMSCGICLFKNVFFCVCLKAILTHPLESGGEYLYET